jgi:hypothetical protein
VVLKREAPALTKEQPMTRYLLSVHTVVGQAPEPMTDEQMQGLMRKVGELEQEMKSADALEEAQSCQPFGSRAPG